MNSSMNTYHSFEMKSQMALPSHNTSFKNEYATCKAQQWMVFPRVANQMTFMNTLRCRNSFQSISKFNSKGYYLAKQKFMLRNLSMKNMQQYVGEQQDIQPSQNRHSIPNQQNNCREELSQSEKYMQMTGQRWVSRKLTALKIKDQKSNEIHQEMKQNLMMEAISKNGGIFRIKRKKKGNHLKTESQKQNIQNMNLFDSTKISSKCGQKILSLSTKYLQNVHSVQKNNVAKSFRSTWFNQMNRS